MLWFHVDSLHHHHGISTLTRVEDKSLPCRRAEKAKVPGSTARTSEYFMLVFVLFECDGEIERDSCRCNDDCKGVDANCPNRNVKRGEGRSFVVLCSFSDGVARFACA